MHKPLVRMLRVNGVQYNANRDPQAYRSALGSPFRLQLWLEGSGEARCSVSDADGRLLAGALERRPGRFTCELPAEAPGTRLVTVRATDGAEVWEQAVRLDTLPAAHAPNH
ncbi:MAG TPA: hypothetical protein VIS77_15505 [Burkholderiales bacterium]